MDNPDEDFQFNGVEIEVGYADPSHILRIDEATFFRAYGLRSLCAAKPQRQTKG